MIWNILVYFYYFFETLQMLRQNIDTTFSNNNKINKTTLMLL